MNIWTIIMLAAIIIFVIIPSFKPRSMSVKKLLTMPAIFMYLAYSALSSNFKLKASDYSIIATGLLVGMLIGIALRYQVKVKADRDKGLIWLPGSYLSLFTFIVIFAVHFAIGYIKASNPNLLMPGTYSMELMVFLLTAASSITVGNSGCLYFKYHTTPMHIDPH